MQMMMKMSGDLMGVPFVRIQVTTETNTTFHNKTIHEKRCKHAYVWKAISTNLNKIVPKIHPDISYDVYLAAQAANFDNAEWRSNQSKNFFFNLLTTGGAPHIIGNVQQQLERSTARRRWSFGCGPLMSEATRCSSIVTSLREPAR